MIHTANSVKPAWKILALLLALFEAPPAAGEDQGRGNGNAPPPAQEVQRTLVWRTVDVPLKAREDHSWWSSPVSATFTRAGSDRSVTVEGFWDGGRRWVIRFAPTAAGEWTYRTHSSDAGLDGKEGRIHARPATDKELKQNANLRGHLRIASNGRYFEYSDGTPFLLLADTLWAGNTLRCGLGEDEQGPFYTYLADRQQKGFTAILMRFLHGFGDEPNNPTGNANEGGYPFIERKYQRLNPEYFRALDARMEAIESRGLVAAVPFCWWGKTDQCPFDYEWAERISEYCAKRYGAFNSIWALSGEYQYAFRDCGWRPDHFTQMGRVVQKVNAYGNPLSIHPSTKTTFEPPHNVLSSKPYHDDEWLDHHWLQTGQQHTSMHRIPRLAAENRALEPVKPVFCSEACYEFEADSEGAYHARWQAWVAMLSGCAGYGYGAHGVWQFYDPDAEQTGKLIPDTVPWQRAIELPGSATIQHVGKLLRAYRWWELEPAPAAISMEGGRSTPTATDLTPPSCAKFSDGSYLVYVPRGNENRRLWLTGSPGKGECRVAWYNPRTGKRIEADALLGLSEKTALPDRPEPAHEDWVLEIRPVK